MKGKRQANIRKHGIDFVDVPRIFDLETITIIDDRYEYDEQRYVTFGLLKGRVIAVAHTENDKIIQIISARKATRNEEIRYFKEIKN
jgi:uncharacterized DUF497 family protein